MTKTYSSEGCADAMCRDAESLEPLPVGFTLTSDTVLFERALGILHRMATENTGWRSFFSRWYFSDEPLRNDAANLVRLAGYELPMSEGTRLVGDSTPPEFRAKMGER